MTWLKDNTDIAYDIEGYKYVLLNRVNWVGGWIKLYYEEHINIAVLENFSGNDDPCERLFVRATVPGVAGDLIVGGVYCPPNKSMPDLTNIFTIYFNYN